MQQVQPEEGCELYHEVDLSPQPLSTELNLNATRSCPVRRKLDFDSENDECIQLKKDALISMFLSDSIQEKKDQAPKPFEVDYSNCERNRELPLKCKKRPVVRFRQPL